VGDNESGILRPAFVAEGRPLGPLSVTGSSGPTTRAVVTRHRMISPVEYETDSLRRHKPPDPVSSKRGQARKPVAQFP
jgi:hypothetical protein